MFWLTRGLQLPVLDALPENCTDALVSFDDMRWPWIWCHSVPSSWHCSHRELDSSLPGLLSKRSDGIMVVCDVTSRESVAEADKWIALLRGVWYGTILPNWCSIWVLISEVRCNNWSGLAKVLQVNEGHVPPMMLVANKSDLPDHMLTTQNLAEVWNAWLCDGLVFWEPWKVYCGLNFCKNW